MSTTITPLLMFQGQAEEAMSFYVALFDDGEIVQVERYAAGEQGEEGTVKHARFRLGDQLLMCIDSPVAQPFTFTPATSLVVQDADRDRLDGLYASLSQYGTVLVPLGEYPFNKHFGWVTDRYGVSWQLSLADD